MANQVNAAENVITHERTIYLDKAADLKIYNWAGWYFRVVGVSSALVSITARIDNEGTEAKTLQLGAGWRHRYFEKLALSWAAQPGESITIEYGGNPLTYRPSEYESYVPSSVSAVEVSNTIAQAVPIKDNGTPLSVNDAALGASFNALLVTLATTALLVKDDETPDMVDDWMPVGAVAIQAAGPAFNTGSAALLYTVTTGKTFVWTGISFSAATHHRGKIWVDDGAGNIKFAMPGPSIGLHTLNMSLPAGYRIYGQTYNDDLRVAISGYEYTP